MKKPGLGWVVSGVLSVLLLSGALVYADPVGGKLRGEFSVYGGYPGDMTSPTAKDTKLGLYLTGPLAARIYRELGPGSAEKQCPSDKDDARTRADITCLKDKADGSTICWIDMNLRTGKSISVRGC